MTREELLDQIQGEQYHMDEVVSRFNASQVGDVPILESTMSSLLKSHAKVLDLLEKLAMDN